MNELAESLVVWNDGCGNVGQRLDRFGDRVGDAFPLGASDALPSTEGFCGFAPFPSVALGADGGFVVAERYPTHYGYGSTVIAPTLPTFGEPASGTLNVGPPPSFEPPSRWDDAPAAASKPDGGFVVAWRSTSYRAAAVIRAKLYRADNTVSADLEVASAGLESAEGLAPSVATSPDGAFLVVWRQERVMGRWYDTHGIELGEAFIIGTTPGRGQPAVAISANGTAVVVWATPGRRRSPAGVFAQRFTARQD